MQCWGCEILHLMLVSYPDGIILEPFVSTGQQSEMDIPEGWDSRNKRRKSGLPVVWLGHEKKDTLSHGFSVKRGLLHKMSMSQTWSPVCGSDLYTQA